MDREVENLEALGLHLAGEQDRVLASSDAGTSGGGGALVDAWRSRRTRVKRTKWASIALAALTCVSAAVWALHPVEGTPLRFSFGKDRTEGHVGALLATRSGESSTARFSDGSGFELAPSTHARVQAVRPDGADLVLEGGGVRSSVVPGKAHLWRLSAGPFTVLVTGTRFDTHWVPESDRFELSLYQGKVSIVGCGMDKELEIRAGETVRASCQPFRYEVTPNAEGVEASWPGVPAPEPEARTPEVSGGQAHLASALSVPTAEPAHEEETRPTVAPSHRADSMALAGVVPPGGSGAIATDEAGGWRGLLRKNRYGDAVAAAVALGFETECEQAGAADLKALGDAAYLSGDGARAETAYKALRRRFAATSQALTAAYSLGRLEFDRRGAYDAAIGWFRTYLTESPSGALAREALGRLMEAEQRSGHAEQARAAAGQYLSRYPEGPHAELARRLAATE